MMGTSRRSSGARYEQIAAADCAAFAWGAACVMSESAEHTSAPPGLVAPAGQPGNADVQGTRRQRRPTGAPPPLPHPISVNTTAWVLVTVLSGLRLLVLRDHALAPDRCVDNWRERTQMTRRMG